MSQMYPFTDQHKAVIRDHPEGSTVTLDDGQMVQIKQWKTDAGKLYFAADYDGTYIPADRIAKPEMVSFTRDDHADPWQTKLQFVLEELTLADVTRLFGKDLPQQGETDKGYQYLLKFRGPNDNDAVVTLYDRYGQWRIGAANTDHVLAFKQWLLWKLYTG